MRPKQFVRAHSMKQEFLIIHTQWVRMNKKKGTDYRNLLREKRALTLKKRSQLKDTARVIASVFEGFAATDRATPKSGLDQALSWLETAPFDNVDHYIIDAQSNVTRD